jgi:hypothetical protein
MNLVSLFSRPLAMMALVLTFVGASASASDLGVLTTLPQVQSLHIDEPDVSFATRYFFDVTSDVAVSASAANHALSLNSASLWGVSDFSLDLYDAASNTLLVAGSATHHPYEIDDVLLSASRYYFQVSGTTIGSRGGSYAFAAVSSTILRSDVTAVPEPKSVALLSMGLALIGLMHLHRVRRHD